jgi:hypothetical protein
MKKSPSMTDGIGSFPLPDKLEPDLDRVRAYWQGLKRGENDIPFWDDVKFSLRTRLAREALLIEVFENPQRFRFDIVGEDVTKQYGKAMIGKFSDEIDLSAPLEEFTGQCRQRSSVAFPPIIDTARCTKGRVRAADPAALG